MSFFHIGRIISILYIIKYSYMFPQKIRFQTVFLFSKSREIKDLLSFLKRFTKKLLPL